MGIAPATGAVTGVYTVGDDPQATPTYQAFETSVAPPHAPTGAGRVYSDGLGQYFEVGGTDAEGAALQVVSILDVFTGEWGIRELQGADLAVVRAAAYDGRTRGVWVLSEGELGVELGRVDLDDGQVTMVVRLGELWAPSSESRFHLTIGFRGELVVSQTGEAGLRAVVLHVNDDTTVSFLGTVQSDGVFPGEPIATRGTVYAVEQLGSGVDVDFEVRRFSHHDLGQNPDGLIVGIGGSP
ncbi:MAG: hypothetical protein AAGA56_13165 [Myxococcota bacterium]